MSIFSLVSETASRVAGGVQQSARRARLEGERRALQRAHRRALERLGAHVWALAERGGIDRAGLSHELADVQSALMEIDAVSTEIDALAATSSEQGHDGPG